MFAKPPFATLYIDKIQDARLAEAVVSYQMTLIGAMNTINDKMEKHGRPEDPETEGTNKSGRKLTGIKEIDGMNGKVETLEIGERRLQAELHSIQDELERMSAKLKRNAVSSSLDPCASAVAVKLMRL
jgi:hypothetical protein